MPPRGAADVDRPHPWLHVAEGMSARARSARTRSGARRSRAKTGGDRGARPSGSVRRMTAEHPPAHSRRCRRRGPLRRRRGRQPDRGHLPRGARRRDRARRPLARRLRPPRADRPRHPGPPRHRRARRRGRPGHRGGDARAARPHRRGARGGLRPDAAQRHRVAAAELPRRLRPDADRHPGRLGHHRHPPDQGADRPRAVDRDAARVGRARARDAAPPGRPSASRSARGSPPPTASSPPSSPRAAPAAPRSTPPCAPTSQRGVEAAPRPTSARRRPAHPPARPRPRGGRRGPRALPARLAPVPRRHRRPRGDLRVGAGGAGPHRGRHARHRRTDPARRPVKEAIEHLDPDPRDQLHGTDALRDWMQERADEAIADMAGTHFDIPGPVRTIECRIAPTQTGGIYYTGPERRLHPARAGCGGRCPRASPSSAPGAS